MTCNFRSAASTEAGAPALIFVACSAARRDRTGLDAAAWLKSPPREFPCTWRYRRRMRPC